MAKFIDVLSLIGFGLESLLYGMYNQVRLELEADIIRLCRGLLCSFLSFPVHFLRCPEAEGQQGHCRPQRSPVCVVYASLCAGIQPLLHMAGTFSLSLPS